MKKDFKNKKQNNFQKPKVIATTYFMKFDNFNDMINELKRLHPVIGKEIFTYDETSPVDALNDISNWFADRLPNIENGYNLHNQITLSATRVSVKTSSFFSFGWKLKYTKDREIINLEATVTTLEKEGVTTDKDLSDMKNIMEENGWKEVEFQPRNKKRD